jgi:predicted nucleic acid-binding protein
MAFYNFDASALVKYYVTEPGSTWVRQVIDAQDPVSGQAHHIILVAEITRVEVAAGLAVIERVGSDQEGRAGPGLSSRHESTCPSLCDYAAEHR